MRGVICYYSGSGNTKLACEYVGARLGIEFDLVDVIAEDAVDLSPYDAVGLAAPTDFGGLPHRFETFLAQLPPQGGRLAFVLNTYGFASGRTLRDLAEQTAARGLTVIGGYSLHMPEDYPPMIAIGLSFADQPKPAVMRSFDAFIAEMDGVLGEARRGVNVGPRPVRFGLLGRLSPHRDRELARRDMGEKLIDAELCIQCGTCAERCPYGAILLSPGPVFDMARCYGCWRCYNQCPQHAIYTAKFRGGPFYPRPTEPARKALRP